MEKYIKNNECDLIALTHNGKVIDYTDNDNEINKWVAQGDGYDWFCVELD